ncbi:response regulator transcription factor [Aquimarina sp. U1-2]|uniref:response regulator transcription factor n=1 Tax=Aquimarina sp. U1-2 TaxID=2823141 RepID=UPI001AED102E|nr:response regulator transcription factor [Aquimarina sp. U1-2]MBP2831886.1 response regulator transcription factor [Aquimarina sp. U1-2]
MFKKILIAEDVDNENLGIVSAVKEFTDATVDTAQFCDKTLLKIKEALRKNIPYDLLISDLSFALDYKKHNITSGKQLIEEVKKVQPDIRIIVFTGEKKPAIIKSFFANQKINGYVCKGLYGLSELTKAITAVDRGNTYTCPVSKDALHQKNVLQLNKYEVQLLKLLAKGYKQDEISQRFIENNITPNSRRSIEDKIRKLRDDFSAKTNIQLVYIVNQLGLIE